MVVFGYSQSSDIASQEMAQLASSSNPPTSGQLSFVLVGDGGNPNGGSVTRFEVPGAPLSLPSFGLTYNTAPTAGSIYPTTVYTQEYDGYADFPQYPIDFLSDLNAELGFSHAALRVRKSHAAADQFGDPAEDDGRHHPVLHDPDGQPAAVGPGALDPVDR